MGACSVNVYRERAWIPYKQVYLKHGDHPAGPFI